MHYGIRWFKCKLKPPKKASKGNKIIFLSDIAKCSAELSYHEPNRYYEVLKQRLWFNSQIKVANEVINMSVKTMKQIVDVAGIILMILKLESGCSYTNKEPIS